VIELWWALEDDEVISPSLTRTSSLDQPGIVSFTVTSTIAPRPVGPNFRKRTAMEAAERAKPFTATASTAGKLFPIAAPYTTLFNLTFTGLVVLDPLNRLE
jgi:hypothetical protein